MKKQIFSLLDEWEQGNAKACEEPALAPYAQQEARYFGYMRERLLIHFANVRDVVTSFFFVGFACGSIISICITLGFDLLDK